MRIGLVGWPGSGKSTLFRALGGTSSNLGPTALDDRPVVSVEVPDERLLWLREQFQPKKFTPARIEFVDFAGIPKGSQKGKSELIAAIREMDALCLVLRGFRSGSYAYDKPEPDPAGEAARLVDELRFTDFAMLSNRVEKLAVQVTKPTKTTEADKKELAFLQRLLGELEGSGVDIGQVTMNAEEERMIRSFQFASQKPRILLHNVAEGSDAEAARKQVSNAEVVFASIEEEIAGLEPAERAAFLESYGLSQSFRDRLIQLGYATMGLCSFFTVGDDEVRAWTIARGDNAVTAAGKIHSDLARGFIRAEVTAYADFRRAGSLREVKAQSLQRLEPKDYQVADGDILNIRFSV